MAVEEVTYDQIDAGGPDDPLGLRKQLNKNKGADPLGLRSKLSTQQKIITQPAFQIKISAPTYKSAPAQIATRHFTDQKPVDELAPIKLQRKAEVAHQAIQTELKGNRDVKEVMIRKRRFEEAARNVPIPKTDQPKMQAQIDVERLIPKETKPQDLPVTDDDLVQEDEAISTDRGKAIRLMEETMKKYPEKAKEIQKNLYTIDAFNSLAPDQHDRVQKIEENAKQVAKGNLVYDARNGQLIKPVGILGGAIEGWKQKSQLFADYDFLKNTENDAAIAMELDDRRNKQDEPIAVPKGKLSEISQMIGGLPIKPLIGGAMASFAGPQAGMAAGAVIGGREFAKLEYAANFQQTYYELREKGVDKSEAVTQARKQAEQAAEVGAVMGGAMGLVGGRLATKPMPTFNLSGSFRQAALNVLKQSGHELGKAAKEGAVVGGIGAAGQIYKNKLAKSIGIDRPLDEGVLEQIEGGLLMTVAMAAAIKAGRGITKANYKSLLHGLSKAPEEQINGMLQEKVQSGEITQNAADETLGRINEYKGLDKLIPENVSEEARHKIQYEILRRKKYEADMESLDKSYHPEIKEKIKAIDEKILQLTKENKVPEEKIESGLSKDQEKEATELAEEWLHEGILPDTFEEMIKKDPIGFWKMIAQQAQNRDANWRPLSEALPEEAIREQFGDTVVDYAKELFPAPEIKESNISVIQPGEIQHPETITIAPKPEQKSGLGEPTVTKVETGDLYEFDSPLGKVAGVQISPTEFRIDGISAREVGKGQGSKLFEDLIGYLKDKGVTTLTTESAGEGAQRMHQKAVEKGLITEVSKEGQNATFKINDTHNDPKTFQEAGELAKKNDDGKVLGKWIKNNAQVGDTLTLPNGDGYEVTAISKRSGDVTLVPFELKEDGTRDYNHSGARIVSDVKLNQGDLFESVYTNSEGERITEQYTYNSTKKSKENAIQKEKIKGFKTSKGSEYIIEDNSTIRNKAARLEHPNDSGLKEKSLATVYLTSDEASKADIIYTQGVKSRQVNKVGNEIQIVDELENGHQRITKLKYKTNPEIGLQPFEVFHDGNAHLGNKITELINSQEDAISIGSPEAINVGETPGNSPAMGEGIPQSGEAAISQEGGGIQETGGGSGQEGIGNVGIHAERPPTQLSFRGLQDTANEFGYEDVRSRVRVSDVQERRNAEVTANEWAERGEYQRNIDDLLSKIENKELVPTAKQRLILEQYLANEKQALRDLPRNSNEFNAQLEKVRRIKEIGQIARQEAGAALRIPNGGSTPHPINDLADAMVAKMEANSVDQLTEKQKADVEAQVEKHSKAANEANEKTAKVEEQVSKLDAEKEFKKVKSTTKRTKKTAAERIAYRRSEIEAAREALRKLRSGESGLSAVPLPGVRELMAIAPHVKNIMVDLVAQGVDNLQDVVSHLHNEFKDVLEGITEKNIHDIIAGEYNEKKQPLSELHRQVRDLTDEAKYINKLEALVNGKEPKEERAKIERNQKIKELKDKIKGFKQEEKESNKFYGESDAGERKLDKLRDELERIQSRRQKEKPVADSQIDKEISAREQEIRDQIKEAQAEWDMEKESARQADRDYMRMETERNRQIKRVADLKEKLENLEKGIKNKNKKSKTIDTPEIEALKKQVSDAEKNLNKTIATEKRIKVLEEELDRLQQRKDKEPKEVNKREISDREKELKDQIEDERKAFRKEQSEQDKFYKEELDDDAKKLIAIKKRNEKRAAEIKEKIAKGDFEKETKTSIFDREDIKKNYPRLRKDALDAIAKKEETQHEFDLALFNDEMAKRPGYVKAADFVGKLVHTGKALMAGIDDSATFVQNGLAMLANPKLGGKVWLKHWKEAFNDKQFKRELAAIHARPDWEIIKNSGLDIVEPHTAASKQVEELFEKNLLAGKIKIKGEEYQPWKYTGGIFERAFTSMGNNFRLSLFEKRMEMLKAEKKTFESHPEEYKDAARSINELTGRGKLPAGLAQASPYITPFIWAPRLLTSTINTLGLSDLVLGVAKKGYYQNLTPTQRNFALKQLGRGVAMGASVMLAASFGGATVDYDPRSVTFGDIVVGDHHYNVFGRYTPVIKALVQAVGGSRVKGTTVQDLDNPRYGGKTRIGVVGGFFRGKMTPFAGAMYDLAEHKNYFTQKPFGVEDLPKALLQPLSLRELFQGWDHDGTWTILNRFLPAFEGLKVSDERDFGKGGGSGGGAGATQSVKVKPIKTHKINPRIKD